MRNRLTSPDDIFKEGKRLLDKAGNDLDLLELAVQKFDAALLERGKRLYPSLNLGPYQLFNRLQTDRYVDAAGRSQISWGHSVRNMSAHAKAHSLTYSHVEDYAEAVKSVLSKTSPGTRGLGSKRPKRKSGKAQDQPIRQTPYRYSPAPPVRLRPEVPEEPMPPLEVESAPIEELEPVLSELPAEDLEPVLSQSAVSPEDNELLSQLLERELGGSPPARPVVDKPPADTSAKIALDNDELLRLLLSTS